ncbi:hypothetical protein F889_01757 [Acinetobacter colistiniresistens]|uniref:Uncharacterized protein n=1 Tax=Acinetobacter colistiniresistens TaxID=280145 RepID=N9R774_9GAMM|nr:hypothetical protein [Acinetobacter colistiniresistens]ENX34475.1 hypothetical protein F889_01757 [Acinetobacter colistiniresistens]
MKNRYLSMVLLGTMGLCVNSAYASSSTLQSMSDSEMSATTGQALMSLSYIAPTDNANLMKNIAGSNNIGFYKLGMEAELELNANIRNLQLGCGGKNGAGACDIDIKNLALSGLPNGGGYDINGNAVTNGGYDIDGNPVYSGNGRAATSAKITNPFLEFAIKNPNSASTREVVGFRASAEKINALLTAGITNNASPTTTDGIQSLSGFMRFSPTTGEVTTTPGLFGKSNDQRLSGKLNALGNNRDWVSDPSSSDTLGISIPSVTANFSTPAFQVNGQRQTKARIDNVLASVNIPLDQGPNNQLKVDFDCILLIACKAKIKLKEGSRIEGLPLNVTFEQSLSMIHNIPLTGTGGYLSLQLQDLLWPGNYIDPADAGKTSLSTFSQASDIAKSGWWMSFANPVNLGLLKGQNPVDVSSVYPQVATKASAFLNQESQRVYAPAGAAIGTLFGITMTTPNPIVIDLRDATPATLFLSNVQLKNQVPQSNCYGSLSFC